MSSLPELNSQLHYALQVAQSLARENQHGYYAPAHLLKGLLHNDVGLASLLAAWGKNIHQLRQWADLRIAREPKAGRPTENPTYDGQVEKLLDFADIIRLKLSEEKLSPLAVLIALCKPDLAFTEEQLKSLPLSMQELLDYTGGAADSGKLNGSPATLTATPATTGATASVLAQYGIDKTALARQGKLDPVIGRGKEIRMITEILGRRTKPNVLLVGEPGVGKSALVDGFAQRIAEGTVPLAWQAATVIELDTGTLVAGAAYKGEVEDRLKKIIAELKQREHCLLFIDEIHVLLDAHGSAAGAANLLKPELARGNVTVIGATTNEEYRKYIEKDEAFNRRFELLRVEEPDEATTVRILKTLLPRYEAHHGLAVAADTPAEAVRLAKRYLRDRQLPDSAIDLLDRTLSTTRLMIETSGTELEALDAELSALQIEFADATPEVWQHELAWFYQLLQSRLSPVLLGLADEEVTLEGPQTADELYEQLKRLLAGLRNQDLATKTQIEPVDVAALVAHKMGIPIGKIQAQERDKLQQMGAQLRQRVIGQDHAVAALCHAVAISRADLVAASRPIGSFFFSGPTGTGKTELAKAVAGFLFSDESYLIRFDMSEFGEKHAAELLIGAPPGYVGYEEGGVLVDQIREKPYAVVLFDEIEKAHPDVFKLFLQILDEGRLTSRLGKVGDFSNAIIIFTSNLASDLIAASFQNGKIPDQETLRGRLGQHFKDEFLGRLDEIIPFAPISRENIGKIFDLQLKSLRQTLQRRGIQLAVSSEARHQLAEAGFSPQYGARPLRAVVRQQIQRPLAQKIIDGEIPAGSEVQLSLDEEHQPSWLIYTPDAQPAAAL